MDPAIAEIRLKGFLSWSLEERDVRPKKKRKKDKARDQTAPVHIWAPAERQPVVAVHVDFNQVRWSTSQGAEQNESKPRWH